MRRREFITLVGSAAATWSFAARAQQPRTVIGFLNGASPEGYAPMLTTFRNGLKERGFVENQNVRIEYRWAEGQYDRLPALVADLIRRQVDVIATPGKEADKLEAAIAAALDMDLRTADIKSEGCKIVSTAEMGEAIVGKLEKLSA